MQPSPLKISDQQEREKALDPEKSFIIQAPAGSGKTELLTQRFLVLLGSVQHPEHILAITFTRKAAREMRNRVLNAIESAKEAEPTDGHLKRTWQLAKTVLARSEEYHWDILDNPTRLRIQTIDAFCASLTRQMPILSQCGAQPRICEDAMTLYRQAAHRVLHSLSEHEFWQDALERLLLHLDNDFSKVETLFINMLASRDQWLPHIITAKNTSELRETLEAGLSRIVIEGIQHVLKHLPHDVTQELCLLANFAAHNVNNQEIDSPIAACLGLKTLPTADSDQQPIWRGFCHLLLTSTDQWRKRVDKKVGFPAPSRCKDPEEKAVYKEFKSRIEQLLETLHPQTELLEAFVDLRQCPSAQYNEQQWEMLQSLLIVLPVLAAQLKIIFAAHARVDFTEITICALDALGEIEQPSDLSLRLDYHIQHILVDEFQDTSIMQFRLLEKLTAGWQQDDGRSLFLVGDPMQSIYRFRQAEVGLFLKAQQEGIGELTLQPLSLQINFRSNANIIDWINETFSQAFPEQADLHTGAISYSPSEAIHPHSNEKSVHLYPCNDSMTQAQQLCDIIKTQSQRNNIAILVKARSHLLTIIPLLQQQGIPFQAVEIATLFTQPIVQDLWALTRALLHSADRLAWLSILRAPWCGLSLIDLHTLTHADDDLCVLSQLQQLEQIGGLTEEGLHRVTRFINVIDRAINNRRRSTLRDWIEQTWLALGGPACLQEKQDIEDANAYFQLLESIEEGADLIDFELFHEQLAKLFSGARVKHSDALQIMTIHKAKGLEFDTVILPELDRRAPINESPLLMWTERPMQHAPVDLILAPIKSSAEESDAIYQYLRREETKKEQHEIERLLYVATTRAKQSLHLLYTVKYDEEGAPKPLHSSSLLSLIFEYVPTSSTNKIETHESLAIEQGLRRLSINWNSPIDHSNKKVRLNPVPHHGYVWTPELHQHIGTMTHRLLHEICLEGIDQWTETRIHSMQDTWRRELCNLGILPKDVSTGLQDFTTALMNIINDPRGRWILNNRHLDSQCEYPLTGIIQDKPQQIIIDRTFIDEYDTRWIIDYKITQPSDNQQHNDFITEQYQKYHPQLQQYATILQLKENRPIHLALYFPLISGWHEWAYSEGTMS